MSNPATATISWAWVMLDGRVHVLYCCIRDRAVNADISRKRAHKCGTTTHEANERRRQSTFDLHATRGLDRCNMSTKSKALSNPYGYYDDEKREYVITRPDTPTPWFNYIGEGRYGGIVSNAAGGFAFDRDPKNRRVSRYRYNSIPADQPGRYVYLRDME
ncbi:MAG TPA: hypothetical protein VIM14_16430, partial [Polyangia bacterium]